jgi:glucose/arabinose dehydrogenase
MTLARAQSILVTFLAACVAACSAGGGSSADASSSQGAAGPSPTPKSTASAAVAPPAPDARLSFAAGFYANVVANVGGARELAALPDGDLLVGTEGRSVAIVPDADGPGVAGPPHTFVTLSEGPAASVIYAPNGAVYAASKSTIWSLPYTAGAQSAASATAIARVRTGPIAPNSDGDVHVTTSLAASSTRLYAGVGSSCNACEEVDPTRATVLQMNLDGSGATNLTMRTRNPVALAIDPQTGALWIGGAGQDALPKGHPYEYMDSPTLRGSANVDYGWPECEENHVPYNALKLSPAPSCANTVAPAVEFPAYATLIGAAFYPSAQTGAYAFPPAYRGGIFVTSHGSWHSNPSVPPRVYYVPMSGDAPSVAVNWNDPTVQSQTIVAGYGSRTSTSYIGRPTGVAVGPNGSLFVADDVTGNILRIRHR